MTRCCPGLLGVGHALKVGGQAETRTTTRSHVPWCDMSTATSGQEDCDETATIDRSTTSLRRNLLWAIADSRIRALPQPLRRSCPR